MAERIPIPINPKPRSERDELNFEVEMAKGIIAVNIGGIATLVAMAPKPFPLDVTISGWLFS